MHEANQEEGNQCDYILKNPKIVYYTLGPKTPAWDRFLFPGRTLRKISNRVKESDLLLIRAPSPLAPAFHKKFGKKTKMTYLIVGDYSKGVQHLDQPWWRKIPITVLSYINDRQLKSVISNTKTLVNSQKLFEKYVPFQNDLHIVKTTTLSQNDFFYRFDTCLGNEIKLLNTGSFSFAKGLRELIEAFALLSKENNLTIHFVGWEYDSSKPVEKYIKARALDLGIADKVFFHGFKTIGPELNEMYRMADIYILPSYHEGFPRTIWEAMANSLPVVATKVGSIPLFLKDRHDAYLIEPQNTQDIVRAVNEILDDISLRQKLIQNGYNQALENTLENQTKKMVELLGEFNHN
jgi:glycosyltransferase involved in cell wall biosynthesis